MISRNAAAEVGASASGERDAEGNGQRSISRSERAAKISTGCRQAARSQAARERYMTALRMLAAVRLEILELPPERIEKALRIIEPRMQVFVELIHFTMKTFKMQS